MESVFNFLGGRKVFFALAVLTIATVAFFIGKLLEAGWLDIVKWTLVAYLGSAVGADAVAVFHKPPEPPAP